VAETACNETAFVGERRAADAFFADVRRVELARTARFVVFFLARFMDGYSSMTS
jgi:hypothetical protein